jgi:predicted small lipoprotein YifL
MKRAIVFVLSLMLLAGGLAGCGYSNGSGPGGASSTSRPGY